MQIVFDVNFICNSQLLCSSQIDSGLLDVEISLQPFEDHQALSSLSYMHKNIKDNTYTTACLWIRTCYCLQTIFHQLF